MFIKLAFLNHDCQSGLTLLSIPSVWEKGVLFTSHVTVTVFNVFLPPFLHAKDLLNVCVMGSYILVCTDLAHSIWDSYCHI